VKAGKLAKNAVPTDRLRDNAVATAKIRDIAVTGAKVKESTLGAVPLAANSTRLEGIDSTGFVARRDPLRALVDGDTGSASIARGSGAQGVSSPNTGRYVVVFDRDISRCGASATLADATATAGAPGEISVDQPTDDSVEVNTYDSAGAATDTFNTDGFYVQVAC